MAKSKGKTKARKQAKARARQRPAAWLVLALVNVITFVPAHRPRTRAQLARFSLVVLILVGSGVAVLASMPNPTHSSEADVRYLPSSLNREYNKLSDQIKTLEDGQSRSGITLVSDADLQAQLANVQLAAVAGRYAAAHDLVQQLANSLKAWQERLSSASMAVTSPSSDDFIPILLYHDTPSDFEQQVEVLEQRGYTTVDLAQVSAALRSGAALPSKPVVITFDDGYADQLSAFNTLVAHHMKATFYIINGGPASSWCIGAGRRYNDPAQPSAGCGDSYLTWDQVRLMDHSGLITIGGHTLDHQDLASLSADDQRHQIADSKTGIEAELGHSIADFAYPYGSYNDTTIQIVRAAGYRTAVTTLPGSYQSSDTLYTLRRLRDTYELP